jgi:hypothetical protein
MPDLGPEASILISFAILFKDTAICFKAPYSTGIMSGKSFKFIGCSDKWMCKLSDIISNFMAYPEVCSILYQLQFLPKQFQIDGVAYFVALDTII